MSPQSPGSPDFGRTRSPLRNQIPIVSFADFCSRLDTLQVEGELDAIFRESPEFGRTLAQRLSPFLVGQQNGPLTLIGAGGEASVFFDPATQQVIKLCGPPARCRFGWLIRREPGGRLTLTPAGADEFLDRLALFESLFSSTSSLLARKSPKISHPKRVDTPMRPRPWTDPEVMIINELKLPAKRPAKFPTADFCTGSGS